MAGINRELKKQIIETVKNILTSASEHNENLEREIQLTVDKMSPKNTVIPKQLAEEIQQLIESTMGRRKNRTALNVINTKNQWPLNRHPESPPMSSHSFFRKDTNSLTTKENDELEQHGMFRMDDL